MNVIHLGNAATIALLLLFAQAVATPASAACAGPDPAIASVAVKVLNSTGRLNRYALSGTVVNAGRTAQASNTLQFVDIYEGNEKLDAKGIPPLKPRQSYAFSYAFARSLDAGAGTTKLTFQLNVRQPSLQNCSAGNDRYSVTF